MADRPIRDQDQPAELEAPATVQNGQNGEEPPPDQTSDRFGRSVRPFDLATEDAGAGAGGFEERAAIVELASASAHSIA